ncbi:MAG: methyl-accepting chemotaxis protein, partial [Pseudomonadota bacterium]
ALRIRTSGFLRQVESLTEKWQSEIDNSAGIRQHMSTAITDLERMSGAINILAINASVEASRAGQSGAAFRVIANEMQRLSQHSSGMLQSTRHTLGL